MQRIGPGVMRSGACLLTIVVLLHSATMVSADDGAPAADETPPVGAGIRPDGIWFLMPGRWGTVQVSAWNSQSSPANLLVTTSFSDDENLQFGRRVWVPAHARVQTSHHVLAPIPESRDQQSIGSETLLYDADDPAGRPLSNRWGQRHEDSSFRFGHDEPVTVVLDESIAMIDNGPDHVSVPDMIYAARYERNLWRNVISIGSQPLPAGETALDAVDQLVIADDRVTQDLLALQGVRRWLFGGGMLWVMLDRVDAAVLEFLLGDECACEVVDRVGLTTVSLQSGPGRATKSEWSLDHEQPVDLVRVLAGGVNVEYTVNGWPAAFWMNCGRGRLLVTTLAADGWVRPRNSADPLPPGGEYNHLFPGPPLQSLATDFFVPRTPLPLPPEIAVEHVREYVGYSIPSRMTVLGMMAAFVVILAGLGHRLSRSGRLEWMGILGPAVALAIGGVLVAIGHFQRQAVPASVSVLQFVQPISGTSDVRISATAGIFSPDAGDPHLAGSRGGWILPDMTGMETTARRLIWTDLESWQWENLASPPGLRTAVLRESQRLPEPVDSEFELNAEGVVGRLSLPAGLSASDGILATPGGRIGVEFEDDGTLHARAEHVLTEEQFLSAGVLSDEQVRRSESIRKMLSPSVDRPFPSIPTLLFWTEPWELEMQFDERFRTAGSALVAIPITFRRPAGGESITIPAPLLPYREAIGVDGSLPTGFFDSRALAWIRKSAPTSTWLQFQAPQSLLPIEPQTARLVIRVTGPVGKLSIAGADEDQIIPVQEWIDPVGTLDLTIDDPRVLSLTGDGRLLLRISGGDPDRPELTRSSDGGIERVSYWRIESLSLELTAVVAGSGNPEISDEPDRQL